VAGFALLAGFVASAFGDAIHMPFLNEDYIFLDQARVSGNVPHLGLGQLLFHWWRPWSRELHYWAVQKLFGPSELAFHLANAALWLAMIALLAWLVRRVAGPAASAWAAAAAAALAMWGLPLLWVAGVQDLWMLCWALAAIALWAADRRGPATAAFALALLSKETACVLPGVFLAWDVFVARRGTRASLARLALPAALVLAWALVHPRLGGRLWHPLPPEPPTGEPTSPAWLVVVRSLLVAANLDALPVPDASGAEIVRAIVPAVLLLVGLALVRWPAQPDPPAPRGLVAFGATWAVLGWLPLLLPGLGWRAYYAGFGALGLLLAIAPRMARARTMALLVLALVAALGSLRAFTPSLNWGEASYQRRAGALCRGLRELLQRRHPSFPSHARLYFSGLPDRIGFLSADGPALRVWYRDSTLSAGYFGAFKARAAAAPRGPDYFFRLDTLRGWMDIEPGAEDVERARAANPAWEADQESVAKVLLRGGDWTGAAGTFEKLATAHPEDPEYAFQVAVCLSQAGDEAGAGRWLARAAALPGASEEIRQAAAAAGVRRR
jgi:hypothetical protein